MTPGEGVTAFCHRLLDQEYWKTTERLAAGLLGL